jgi:YegS/Rv2252/BmrU family lipid kinase
MEAQSGPALAGDTLLVANPQSRRGERIDEARTVLARHRRVHVLELGPGVDVAAVIAERPAQIDRVVVAGGDGTINTLLRAVLEADLPLGVLPLGTANDLAGTLGLPKDPVAAAEVIEAGLLRRVDVGVVNGHPFLNAVGVGLGPRLTRRLTGQAKARWGVGAYIAGLVQAYRDTHPFSALIDCDGTALAVRALQITIGNGRQYGGGMVVSDAAAIDDAALDVLCVEPRPISDLLRHALALKRGRGDESPVARTARGRRVRVTTTRPLDVTADGEILTSTPIDVTVKPGALRVFSPPPTPIAPQPGTARGDR